MSSPPPIKLSLPLAYQQEIYHEIREEDGLVILGRGLGVPRIVSNLLHAYDAAGSNLVLLIGADERENDWIGESLVDQAVISKSTKARNLCIVNTDAMSISTRQKLYARGGIFSITSRILVVDMLTGLINPETITGLVVLHADRVIATSMEAFIIRIFRQKNKNGFIKAFSDNPEPFTTGFSPLATMMRNLFVRRSMIWPRIRDSVQESLKAKGSVELVELEVQLTDSMRDIQTAILECIEASIAELRKSNSQHLELEDWTIDSALHKNFDVIVRRQLDPVWHRVSYKTRQIVSDLTEFRTMLHSLLSDDCVNFYRYLETILATNTPPPGSTRQTQAPWLFLDAAHTIFSLAKRRMYTGEIERGKQVAVGEIPAGLIPRLEEQPKWAMLATVLQEIEREIQLNLLPMDSSNSVTLIMCSDEAICRQLKEYLQLMNERLPNEEDNSDEEDINVPAQSAKIMLRRRLRSYFYWKRDSSKAFAALFSERSQQPRPSEKRGSEFHRGRAPPNKRRRVRGGASVAAGPSRAGGGVITIPDDDPNQVAQLVTGIQPTKPEQMLKYEIAEDPMENMEDYYELFDLRNLVVVHPYDGDNDDQVLEELKPRYIVMYEPDAAFVRRVEVYRSSHHNRNVRVYFMYYEGSVEERRYLSAVRKEKDAFAKLIRERSTMAVTLTTDGHGVTDPQEQFLRTVNTRIAGGGRLTVTADPPRVVVDVREFRSSLPSLLHGRNMVIVPCMLTVGDYILTPDICVERKSIKDLISSFKDGRLYNQCEVMFNYYKYPMLLIEFDQNKSFNLEPFADMSVGSTINTNDLQSKLVLLTIAFPQLRIIWSSSPYHTAEIFEELKKNLNEPDPVKAVQAGLEEGEDAISFYNQTPQDMLRAVPGVTIKNYKNVMVELENMMEVVNLEEEELSKMVGPEAGRQMYRFFNKSLFD